MPLTLWVALALEWLGAAVFAVLAAALLRRPVRDDAARLANVLFAIWWLGLGLSRFFLGLRLLMVPLDVPLTLVVGLSFISSSAVAIGLAGLLYYLLYLFTGRSFLLWPLLAFYALFCGWIISSTALWNPIGLDVSAWGASVAYAEPYTTEYRLVVLLVLVAPQVLAVLALYLVALRMPPSAGRVRTLVVATGVSVYILNALLAPAFPAESALWQTVHLTIPIAVGLGVLAAHRPPRWLRWRLPPEMPGQREATP